MLILKSIKSLSKKTPFGFINQIHYLWIIEYDAFASRLQITARPLLWDGLKLSHW